MGPTKICCGQKHWSVTCPDGKTMCILCFNKFSVDQLAKPDGVAYMNICKPCYNSYNMRERI